MRILVFQHSETVHPGVYRDMMRADGAQVTTVDLERGGTVPDLAGFDALWVMGGPMNVWEDDEYPWLVDEKQAIREAVEVRNMGYFGLCLGHQLLAAACGGEVAAARTSEIGVMTIDLTREGAQSAWFAGVESGFPALQWHYAEVVRPPEGAHVLAHSPACAVQAMTLGPRVLSLQFHLEATRETVNDWRAIPGTDELLVEAMGDNGAQVFTDAFIAREEEAHAVARKVYANWRNAVLATPA